MCGVIAAVVLATLLAMFDVVAVDVFTLMFAATAVTEITPVIAHEYFAALFAGKSFSHV